MMQFIVRNLPDAEHIQRIILWCLAPLAAMLVTTIGFGWNVESDLFVAIILPAYLPIRMSSRSVELLQYSAQRFPRIWLFLIGAVHGLSNLGVWSAKRICREQPRR